MAEISTTEAKYVIGRLWSLADHEPVTVTQQGSPRYVVASADTHVVVSREEWERMIGERKAPQFGFAKELFGNVDTDALLAVDVSEAIEDAIGK